MIYTVRRFTNEPDSSPRPVILDLKRVERKLIESGLSKREVDIILDGLRGCDEPEKIMEWVKTGKVDDPEIEKIMKKTGLSFPAAYIELREKSFSKNKKVTKKLKEDTKDYEGLSRSKKLALLNDSAAKIDLKSGEYHTSIENNENKPDSVERHYVIKSLVDDKQSFYSLVNAYKENLKWYKSDLSRNQNKETIEELRNRNPEKEVDSWNTHHKISEAGRKHQVRKLKKDINSGIKRATLENEHPKLAALKSTLFSVTNNPINRFKRAYQEQKGYLQDEGNKKSIKEEISRYQKGNDPEEIKKRYLKYHPENTNLESKEAKKGMGEMKKAGDWMIKRDESFLDHPKREALKYAAKNWRNY
jgi:hypothetical protein